MLTKAPNPITAFMSVGSKVAGFVAIVSILQVLGSELLVLRPILIGVSIATMAIGSIVAISQTSIKRMLAYSSISHAGFVMLGVLSGDANGLHAAIFYLAATAITNFATFAVVMLLEANDGSDLTIADLTGLWQRHPWSSAGDVTSIAITRRCAANGRFLCQILDYHRGVAEWFGMVCRSPPQWRQPLVRSSMCAVCCRCTVAIVRPANQPASPSHRWLL
jgi:hypothetical protein